MKSLLRWALPLAVLGTLSLGSCVASYRPYGPPPPRYGYYRHGYYGRPLLPPPPPRGYYRGY